MSSQTDEPTYRPGDVITAAWPFLRDTKGEKDNRDHFALVASMGGNTDEKVAWEWKPGTRMQSEGGLHSECDAMGWAEFTVVAITPLGGRYQDRVFYKRVLVDPEGKRWGGKDLRVATIGKFERWTNGWKADICLAEEGWLDGTLPWAKKVVGQAA